MDTETGIDAASVESDQAQHPDSRRSGEDRRAPSDRRRRVYGLFELPVRKAREDYDRRAKNDRRDRSLLDVILRRAARN